MSNLPLASEFPPASRELWRKLVDGVLKGAPFDRKLVARPMTRCGLSRSMPVTHRHSPCSGENPDRPGR